jgi:hypothetical protein
MRHSKAWEWGRQVRTLCDRMLEARFVRPSTLNAMRGWRETGAAEFLCKHGRVVGAAVLILVLVVASLRHDQPAQPAASAERPSEPMAHVANKISEAESTRTAHFQATYANWSSLQAIQEEVDSLPRLPENQSPDQMATQLTLSAERITEFAKRILALPTLNVDDEVVEYASKTAKLYSDTSSCVADLSAWIRKTQSVKEQSESAATMVESFFRGMMGDPLGKHSEIKVQMEGLDREHADLGNRVKELQRITSDLNADEHRLRALLSKRYDQEFPSS